jgi:hypothetical protein
MATNGHMDPRKPDSVPQLKPGAMMLRVDPVKDCVTFRGKADQFAIADTEFTVPFPTLMAASIQMQAILAAKLYSLPTQIDIHAQGAPPPGTNADSVHGPGTPPVRLS